MQQERQEPARGTGRRFRIQPVSRAVSRTLGRGLLGSKLIPVTSKTSLKWTLICLACRKIGVTGSHWWTLIRRVCYPGKWTQRIKVTEKCIMQTATVLALWSFFSLPDFTSFLFILCVCQACLLAIRLFIRPARCFRQSANASQS